MAELKGDFEVKSGGDPSSDPDGSITVLLGQLKNCPPHVLEEIWRRFFPRMTGLARRTLVSLPKCHSDAVDVAQSAFISFWHAVEARGDIELADRDELWRLLGVVTVRKARRKVRSELAQKRGGGITRSESELGCTGDAAEFRLDRVLADVTPPEFDLCCEESLLALEERQRAIAMLRLHGYSSSEIAELLECSPRSVQRAIVEIRELWKQAADDG